MSQFIDKSAIVAEIERRMQELHPTNTHKMQVCEKMDRDVLMWLNALTWVKKVIDTLEVKEVNLDIEVALWANAIPEIRLDDIERLAKYFFELGLKAQKGK